MTTADERAARRDGCVQLARRQGGVVTSSQVTAVGATYAALEAEVTAGRWTGPERGVLQVSDPDRTTALWRAVLATSPRTDPAHRPRAAVAGLSALQVCGLTGVEGDRLIHVAAPKSSRPVPLDGSVRIHETRRWRDEDVRHTVVPHVRPAVALLQAAFWARTDREAALMVCAPLQQRLTTTDDVHEALALVRRAPRRRLVEGMLAEFTGGVHSLNELNFARMCRSAVLPEPDRQVAVRRPGGTSYLDVRWSRWEVAAEVDGVGHLEVSQWLADSRRHNELVLTQGVVLRIPSIGLRLDPAPYLRAVRQALISRGWCPP